MLCSFSRRYGGLWADKQQGGRNLKSLGHLVGHQQKAAPLPETGQGGARSFHAVVLVAVFCGSNLVAEQGDQARKLISVTL